VYGVRVIYEMAPGLHDWIYWHALDRSATMIGPSIIGKEYLQRLCIATEVTQFLLAYSLPRECVYRVIV
jgi:hypothetical protein